MKTAIAYIKCEGNTKLTADSLFIHENTVRYRMNKIREKLDPNANDFVFYENLSLAVKIYLLNDQMYS
jgi:DNA-binding PucR family transcriptional regulator